MEDNNEKNKLREETINKWKKEGLLEGLTGNVKENIGKLFEPQLSYIIDEEISEDRKNKINLSIFNDIEYLKDKRDTALQRFNTTIHENNYTDEEIETKFKSLLRCNKQLKIMEDLLIFINVTQHQKTKKGD